MPGRAGGAGRRSRSKGRRWHRASADEVRSIALEIVRRARGPFASQAALLEAVRRRLRGEDPLAAVGARRLRRELVGLAGVRIEIEYAERGVTRELVRCPVCGTGVVPIRNRTLDAAPIVLGHRCPACGYWTHRRRRVPVRYTFRASPSVASRRSA